MFIPVEAQTLARKTADITITSADRDHGKVFRLTEMDAPAAEKWAWKALLALGRSGTELPAGIFSMGMQGVAIMGMRAVTSMSFDDGQPLLDEMMGCIMAVPDPARPAVVRALVLDDMEEVATILFLRDEVLKLHTGFSPAAVLLDLGKAAKPSAKPSRKASA